jgi:Putative DNA-binding domain
MDFVGWCEAALATVQEKTRADPQAGIIGVNEEEIARATLPDIVTQRPDFWSSDERVAALFVLQHFEALGLLEQRSQTYYRITQRGREHVRNPLPLWTAVCSTILEDDHALVLRTVNRASLVQTADGAYLMNEVDQDQLLADLGWADTDFDKLYAACAELERMQMLKDYAGMGRYINARSTYLGAVWDMRQGETLEAAFLDQLRAEGETTSVDFKRELHLGNDNEKAEFVKDVLGLATTQASGRRWLIIGFDDKTQAYHAPPDPSITQNRLEQILSVYTTPQVQVRYEVVTYRGNQVGKLEIFRDRTHLPYRVARPLGHKKRIDADDIFVRHGSQTEHPTVAEEQAIQEEGDRARATSP